MDKQIADTAEDEHFMTLALEEARLAYDKGEVPVGAIVVHKPYDRATRKFTDDARILARGHNLRETSRDASAHAETLAMRKAMRMLDAWRLQDCTVYVTLEPCIMCAGLMQQARIARCVFGAFDPKGGALSSLYRLNDDERLNHRFKVEAGVLENECSKILKDFFKAKRQTTSNAEK